MPATPRVAFGRDQHMLAESGQEMTTQWTTIRGWLGAGRRTHRPPRSGRKAGHRIIVAPLAAGVAASVAVGVGLSMARIARERRAKRDLRLGLLAGESLGSGLQRMALGQLDLVLSLLGGGESTPDERAVHETRKALKRLRALLRLLEPALDRGAYERESSAVRDAGKRLAVARDAEVMLETLDNLIKRHPRRLTGQGGVIRLRATLLAERERARRETLSDPRAQVQVLAELRACRVRVAAWQLTEHGELELVQAGLLHLYRQGDKRRRRATRAKKTDIHRMHEWRKRVKDLRYAAEMLQPAKDGAQRTAPKGKRSRARHERLRKDRAWLKRMARRADELGEVLGEDHDLAVLALRIEREAEGPDNKGATKRARKALLKLIAERRRKLQRRALREGKRLYEPGAKQLMRHVRGAHRAR